MIAWNVVAGKETTYLMGEEGSQGARPVRFSSDGRLLALGGDHLCLREVASGIQVYSFERPGSAVAFAPDGRTLATAFQDDGNIQVWDLLALFRGVGGPTRPPMPGTHSPWEELSSWDGRRAYQAIGLLMGNPEDTVALLERHLRPAALSEEKELARLLQDLDSPEFATRERATAALQQAGEAARGSLESAARATESPEVRSRLKRVLQALRPISTDKLRQIRAVQVLEYLDTPAARRLLRRLAAGTPEARLTREAHGALARLERRALQDL
jgi:hypothetical protein